MKTKKLTILSMAALGSLWTASVNAQTFNYSTGDLLVGFRSASANQDLVVDIGSASQYIGATSPITISGTFFTSQQLADAGLSLNGLSFSVFGDSPSDNLWITNPRADVNVQSSPWIAGDFFAQAQTAGKIEGIAAGAQDVSSFNAAGPDNTSSAVVVPSTFSFAGDVSYTLGMLGPSSVGNFGNTFQGIVENTTASDFTSGNTPVISDLYELDTADANQPGKLIGDFELDANGTLTFNPVPEPTTGAVLVGGMLLFAAAGKFRRK